MCAFDKCTVKMPPTELIPIFQLSGRKYGHVDGGLVGRLYRFEPPWGYGILESGRSPLFLEVTEPRPLTNHEAEIGSRVQDTGVSVRGAKSSPNVSS